MAYLNKVMLIGNVGKDLDVRVLANGKVVSFSLATSRRYKDNNGETKEDTQWHTITAWGKVVDTLQMLHVGKGSKLYVEGSLSNRSWTDQASGQKRYATEVKLETFQILTSLSEGGNGSAQANSYNRQTEGLYNAQQGAQNAPAQRNPYSHGNGATAPAAPPEEDDDGLPF